MSEEKEVKHFASTISSYFGDPLEKLKKGLLCKQRNGKYIFIIIAKMDPDFARIQASYLDGSYLIKGNFSLKGVYLPDNSIHHVQREHPEDIIEFGKEITEQQYYIMLGEGVQPFVFKSAPPNLTEEQKNKLSGDKK